jgi:hypothetical protein
MPTGNRGNILFTSRNRATGGSSITRETSLNVENLDQKNAISLLLKSAWLDESSLELRQAAAPIVDALCLLPLAIDQAGAAIRSGSCTINDYLRMYSEHRRRLMSHSSYKGASNYGRAVYATWDLSFAAIEANTSGPDLVAAEAAESAIVILQTFACFHHDNILEDIIRRAAEAPWKPRDDIRLYPSRRASYNLLSRLLQRQKDGRWDPLFFREGIQVLLSFSLIKRNGNWKPRFRCRTGYSIHHGRSCIDIRKVVGSTESDSSSHADEESGLRCGTSTHFVMHGKSRGYMRKSRKAEGG